MLSSRGRHVLDAIAIRVQPMADVIDFRRHKRRRLFDSRFGEGTFAGVNALLDLAEKNAVDMTMAALISALCVQEGLLGGKR
jgi:hypothetical protein